MYNRYIPQPDGSHRRRRMDEPKRAIPTPVHPRPHQPPCAPPDPPPCPPPESPKPPRKEPAACPIYGQSTGLGSFFRQLLPKELDTGDLLILLLLLLMAGDCEEDRKNALLTMALYFLM